MLDSAKEEKLAPEKKLKRILRVNRNNFSTNGWDLAYWLQRLTANAPVATVLGSILASVGTVES